MQDPIVAARLRRLVSSACLQIAGGADTEALLETVERGIAQGALIAVALPRANLGTAEPPRTTAPPAATVNVPFARMSSTQRIVALLERTPSHLGPDLAAAFRQMVTVEALAGIAAAFAVLLAAQFVGVGEIADAALAWWAYSQAGLSGVYGLYEALRAVVAAVRAPDEAAFEQAVVRFAAGLSVVGVALLTVVVTRAARRGAGGKTEPPPESEPPPPPPSPKPPPRTRLPRTNGHWDGTPGDSNWYSDNPKVNAVTDGQPIPFRNGRPDFSAWSKGDIEFEPGTLDGSPNDFSEVYKYVQDQKGLPSQTAAQQMLSDMGLTPHHLDENTIQLIPTDLHGNIPHIGSAADLRGPP